MTSLRLAALALCAFAALPARAGSDTDPIIGAYSGNVLAVVAETAEGLPGTFNTLAFSDTIDIEFATSNVVTIDTLVGTWKKKGATHAADISAAATAALIAGNSDPSAKATAKYKKIALTPSVGVAGKFLVKRSFHLSLIAIHDVEHGVFGALLVP